MNSVEQVWNDYHRKLRGFIGKKVRKAADADDILQNVFLKVCTRFETLREADKIQGWLYRIAAHAVIDFYRTQKFEARLSEEIEPADLPTVANNPKCFQDPQKCLLPMIERLPATYQVAVKLSELQGLANKQVARVEGVSLTAIKSRIRRGRKMIRKMLDDCCRFEIDLRGKVIDCQPKNNSKRCC